MSNSKYIEMIEKEQMNKEIPEFSPGDTVVVQVKIKEGIVSVCRLLKALSSVSVTVV